MKKLITASALALAFASTAQATDFDLKVGVLDQGTEEGYVVGASVQAMEGLTVSADYKDVDMLSLIEAGFKYELGVTEGVDLVGGLSYLQADFDDELAVTLGYEDDSALSLQAGLRTGLAEGVTFEFGMERMEWDEADYSDFAPYLSASVDVTESVKVSFQHREALEESAVVVSFAF